MRTSSADPATTASPPSVGVSLFIGDGYIELEGRIGENAAHSHLAFQLTIGLDGPVELIENAPPGQGPRDWARAAHLSPSRFRALCVALLGAPPVRLRQWGRLKAAGRELAAGAGLAEAAAAAGHADQAHFTRQLRRWFGVSPARGLASLSVRVVP